MSLQRVGARRRVPLTHRWYLRSAWCLLVAAVVLTVISPKDAPAASPPSSGYTAAPHSVIGLAQCTFVDPTRAVLDYATTPASPRAAQRTLLTEIRYPALSRTVAAQVPNALPRRRPGGYPLIVFAHGYDVTPDVYASLLDHWSAAGFIVVAPYFPDEKPSTIVAEGGADTEGDLANEPGDIAFIIRQVLVANAHVRPGCPVLRAVVRPTRIAIAGHSDGANAVAMLAYDHARDPQGQPFSSLHRNLDIRAVIVLAGAETPQQSYGAEAGHPALLVVQSIADTCNPIRQGLQLYRDIRHTPKWFLELITAHHLPAFDGADPAAFQQVLAVTTRFLTTSLDGSHPTPGLEVYANRHPAIARMYDSAMGPSLRGVTSLGGVCVAS